MSSTATTPLIPAVPGAAASSIRDWTGAVRIVHWRMFERVMDMFWVGVLFYGSIQAFISASGNGASGWVAAIIAALIFWSLAGYLVLRPIRHVIWVTESAVLYQEYRCFGYLLKREETFERNDLGCLVFDSERRCMGLWGFMGVYVTRGVPKQGAPVSVAFQIPIIYNGWVTNALRPLCVQSHLNTYNALKSALKFNTLVGRTVTQKTTRNWEYVSGHAEMHQQMMDDLTDSLASYEEFVAINGDIYPSSFTFEKSVQGGRAVFPIKAAS